MPALLLPLLAATALPHLAAQQYRAFWADAFHSGYKSPSEIEQLVEDLGRARANAIFVQARRRADSYYLTTPEVPAQDATYSPRFDALQYLIERAHAKGIEVHAWFVVYPLWPTTIAPPVNPEHLWYKHGPRAQGEDMWMQISSTGAIGGALDPGHPAVQRYLAEVITEPVRHYSIDGIHLDYIRYSEDADYGWNPVSVERFNRLEGRSGQPVPRDAAWSEFRRRQVTALMRQVYLRALEIRPAVKVSAALISWGNGPQSDAAFRSSDAYATVFQDWRSWLEEGILDLAMPMHYFREPANAAFLERWVDFARSRQFNRLYVPGLGVYLNSIDDTMRQLTRVLAPGAEGQRSGGAAFYSYASTNTLNAAGLPLEDNAGFYSRLGDFFGEYALPPSLPWKENPTAGHVAGTLEAAGGPAWLADGVTVRLRSDTGRDFERTAVTDGTGFFGFVDVPPDRYRLRLERDGALLWDATPQDVTAGQVTRFDVHLKAGDFAR